MTGNASRNIHVRQSFAPLTGALRERYKIANVFSILHHEIKIRIENNALWMRLKFRHFSEAALFKG